MPTLQVCLFGSFSVRRDNVPVEGFDVRKVRDLFAYLLLARDRRHAREALAEQLWPECAGAQSRKSLRQALWQLQLLLGGSVADLHRILTVDADWIQVNGEADLWLDVTAFEDGFAGARGVPCHALPPQAVGALASAVQLYRGDLLEGCYQSWCQYERERLQSMYLLMLDKLMGYAQLQRDYETGLAYGAQILRYDQAHERTHRRLMRLYYLSGDRAAALRQYERCTAALEKELGVRPARRTSTLYEQIRLDRLVEAPLAAVEVGQPPRPQAAPLSQLLGRLKSLQAALAALEAQLQHDIQAIEQAP